MMVQFNSIIQQCLNVQEKLFSSSHLMRIVRINFTTKCRENLILHECNAEVGCNFQRLKYNFQIIHEVH